MKRRAERATVRLAFTEVLVKALADLDHDRGLHEFISECTFVEIAVLR